MASRLLVADHADDNGIVRFDYHHHDEARGDVRKWVTLLARIYHQDCCYIGASGLRTAWHGFVAERYRFDSRRVIFENPPPGRSPIHQLLFQDLHSFFGIEQDLLFTQAGPFCWRATHRRGASVHIVLRSPERRVPVPVPLAQFAIPIPLPDLPDRDDDWTMLEATPPGRWRRHDA